MDVQARYGKGYTVIELMAVLAIASTLLIVAIPMFRTQVQNARMAAAATDLFSTLASARAEAVGRNYPVKVCISNNDPKTYACADTGQWEDGWLTFIDEDRDGELSAGEEIRQIHAPLADGITARGTEAVGKSVTFQPNGRTDAGETEGVVICDTRNYRDASRTILVSMMGKVSIRKADEIGHVLDNEQAARGECLRGDT